VREAIAQAEVKGKPLCVLSLDFQEAFDRISHQYLFNILRDHGFNDLFIERIKCMYENAISSVQINGHIAGPIPTQCSIRQACPKRMTLFALCIDPLLRTTEQKLPGIRIGNRARKTVVFANADDVTIFVTTPTGQTTIQDPMQCYGKATESRLNLKKSKPLAVGGRSTKTIALNIPYQTEIKILAVTFTSTVEHSMKKR